MRGGGRVGVQRLARELRIPAAVLLAEVQAEPLDPGVPGDTIPHAASGGR